MHIAVAGNIGSGKTTLTKLLADHFNWKTQFEELDNNPYISDFYKDMKRWSFNLQIFFLQQRLRNVIEIKSSKDIIIQDRTIYEDARIFAANLHEMGLMSSRDFESYTSLFDLMMTLVLPPDMLIYLQASVPTLVKQIQKRGREFETDIRVDYLTRLNERYEKWIDSYQHKKLIIKVDTLNFDENPKDLDLVIDQVKTALKELGIA